MKKIIIYRKSNATVPDSTIATANMALADNYAFGRFSNKQAKFCLLDKLRNFTERNTEKIICKKSNEFKSALSNQLTLP